MALSVLYGKSFFMKFLDQKEDEFYALSHLDSLREDFENMMEYGSIVGFSPRFIIYEYPDFMGKGGECLTLLGILKDDDAEFYYGTLMTYVFGPDTHIYYGGTACVTLDPTNRTKFISIMKDITRRASIEVEKGWDCISNFVKKVDAAYYRGK